VPTDKKKSLKEKSSTAHVRGIKQTGAGYGKKTALLEEAITHMNAGKYGRSSAALKELLAMDPHNMEARRLFATLHLRLGSLIPARQAFDSLIDEAFSRQDYWLAESLLREYLAAGPRCVPYIEKLGAIFEDKGEILEAVAEYGKAIDILIEDPDPDDPNHAARIYEKIKSLAPASPVALRLVNCFDVQTGALISRQAVVEPTPSLSTQDDSGTSTDSTESGGDQIRGQGEASELDETVDSPLPPESSAGLDAGEQTQGPALESVADVSITDTAVAESDHPVEDPAELTAESLDAPTFMDGPETLGCDPATASNELSDAVAPPPVTFESPLSLPPDDAVSFTVSGAEPRPTVEASPPAAEAESDLNQVSDDNLTVLLPEGGGSGDPVTEDVGQLEGPSLGVVLPVETVGHKDPEMPEETASATLLAEPQTVESEASLDVTETDHPLRERDQDQELEEASSSGTPMPWEQVQDSTIRILPVQSEELVVEPLVERRDGPSDLDEAVVASVAQEPGSGPVHTWDVVQSPHGVTENAVFSLLASSPPVPPVEMESVPAGVSPVESRTEGQTSGANIELHAEEFSYVGDSPASAELETRASEGEATEASAPLPPPIVDEPLPVQMTVSTIESDAPSHVAPAEFPTHGLIQQEEWNQPSSAEAKAPVSQSVTESAIWLKPKEPIQLIQEPAPPQETDPVHQKPQWGEQPGSYPTAAAAAVDVLFQPSGRVPEAEREAEIRERPGRPKPERPAALSRIGRACSSALSSCFSTTHAIVMSLIGLVVVVLAVIALGIGAVGLTWLMMEESPSAAYQRFTAGPPSTLPDSQQNGYLVLLGFDATSEDPLQAGAGLLAMGKDVNRTATCIENSGENAKLGQANASAKVLSGWVRGADPIGAFAANQGTISGWVRQGDAALNRYRRWQRLPFEDRGYGQAVAVPCASINFAHHLYVAEGFMQQTDIGVERLEADMEAWRTVLAQAKTIPVKTLAIQAVRDDAAVASGLLARPDFDNKYVGRLSRMLRPMNQAELSIRWPMQSEVVWASKSFNAQVKAETEEEHSIYAAVASVLPLPKQRRLNGYAAYYEAAFKAAEEGRYSALPKRGGFVRYPAETMTDYFTNPIENVIGVEPLPGWDVYNGMVVDVDAHLRLASLQAWIRRGLQDGELLPRIAKAGQSFYDPYTGLPMLVNLNKRVLYSVGHDGKDQDGDFQDDVAVAIPAYPTSVSQKPSSNSFKSD
jgi:hypothetical protein